MFKDVLATMDLTAAPIIALVAFFSGFVGILIWLAVSKEHSHFNHMNELPLHDGAVATAGNATGEGSHE